MLGLVLEGLKKTAFNFEQLISYNYYNYYTYQVFEHIISILTLNSVMLNTLIPVEFGPVAITLNGSSANLLLTAF